MKSTILTLAFALCAFVATATVHRVNNSTGNNNNANSATFYTTWAAAYAAAVANDTIIIEPSGTVYTSAAITIDRKLTIIGNGFAGWIPANTQVNTVGSSTFHSIILAAGSAGSYITGLTFTGAASSNSVSGSIIIAANDIVIQRCKTAINISLSSTTTTNNTIIKECYLDGYIASDGSSANSNIVIKNNILFSRGVYFGANDNNIVVENNIFQWWANNGNSNFNNAPAAFNNNIMRGALDNSGNVTINNNICIAGTGLPIGNGNQNSVVYNTIFNGTAPPNPLTDDARLKVGSVALGAGTGGYDIGAYNTFAGSSSYVQGGVPSFPSLYYFNIGTISNNIMNVTISAKANN